LTTAKVSFLIFAGWLSLLPYFSAKTTFVLFRRCVWGR